MQDEVEMTMDAIPMPASISMASEAISLSILGTEEAVDEMTELGQLVPIQTHIRKTGRPPNPAWQYFIRGTKRNGFHYHAYCKYCVDQYKKLHGEMNDESVFAALNSIRGVSTDMIKHLEKCCHCPQEVVTGLQEYWAELRKVDDIVPAPKRSKFEPKESMKTQVWKATIAAGLDLQWFQHPLVQTLIAAPRVNGTLSEMIAVASVLGKAQFDRIKELSPAKGSLTLSVNVWKSENAKHILSMSLISNEGTSCAISVDVLKEWTIDSLQDRIRKCLLLLRRNSISIIGIVADSILALQAAYNIQANDAPELIVQPCFIKMIDTISSLILTDKSTSPCIGTIIEIMSYLRHPKVLNALPELQVLAPMANSIYSVVNSIHTFITLQNTIESNLNLLRLPKAFNDLIISKQWWIDVSTLHNVIDPIHEIYEMLKSTLSLSHIAYAFGRMHQRFTTLEPSDLQVKLVQTLHSCWQLYDMPTMVLAVAFDVQMDIGWLLQSSVRSMVASYFQLIYARWFHLPLTIESIQEILHAVDTRSFPFDSQVQKDIWSFYSILSNSYPELCALCSRLYSVAVTSNQVPTLLSPYTSLPEENLLPILHIAFATTPRKEMDMADREALRWMKAHETQAKGLFCVRDWISTASQWKAIIDEELQVLNTMYQSGSSGLEELFCRNELRSWKE